MRKINLGELGKGRKINFDSLILLKDNEKLRNNYIEDREEKNKLIENDRGIYIGIKSKKNKTILLNNGVK